MINKPFDAIEKGDIDYLLTEKVAELRTLEYKQSLPGGTDKDKKEFLADISSFANAAGGDILYGIEAEKDAAGKPTGRPGRALGIADINGDALILSLHNQIRDGLDPRIPVVQIKPIEGFPNGPVILIRIVKSWSSPHMVKYGGSSRFYSRTSAGKYQLDASEIRSTFVLSGSLPERIRNFRIDRLAKIVTDDTPIPLIPNPKLILHILPVSAFMQPYQIDLHRISYDPPFTLFAQSMLKRFNLDGLLTYSSIMNEANSEAYVQVFRNGTTEMVDASLLIAYNQSKALGVSIERARELFRATGTYLMLMKRCEIHPPVVIMLTLVGVKGRTIQQPDRFSRLYPIDRDDLLLPEIVVEDFSQNIPDAFCPIFDALWQSAGHERCPYYDRNGKWQGEG